MDYNPGLPSGEGINNNQPSYNEEITWLDYTILKNPNGIMTVLSKYGYIGYLAPQNSSELKEVSLLVIQKHEDKAIIDFLRVHPDYDVIKETPRDGYYTKNEMFDNFTEIENNTTTNKKRVNFNTGLILIGGMLIIAALIYKE